MRTAAISGSVTMIVAAMISPHGCWNALPDLPTNDVIAIGNGVVVGALDERQCKQVLVPRCDEGEQARCHETGRDQRQEHLVEDLDRSRAVDVRRLLEIPRQRLHEAGQHPDREGQREDEVGEDQRPAGVVQLGEVDEPDDVKAADHRVQRAEDRDLREDRHRQHQVHHERAAAEAESSEGIGGQRADRERQQRHGAGDDRRVDQGVAEERGFECRPEVVERRVPRKVLERRREERVVGRKRGAERPEERKQRVDEDERDQEVERALGQGSPEAAAPEGATSADRAGDGLAGFRGGAHVSPPPSPA